MTRFRGPGRPTDAAKHDRELLGHELAVVAVGRHAVRLVLHERPQRLEGPGPGRGSPGRACKVLGELRGELRGCRGVAGSDPEVPRGVAQFPPRPPRRIDAAADLVESSPAGCRFWPRSARRRAAGARARRAPRSSPSGTAGDEERSAEGAAGAACSGRLGALTGGLRRGSGRHPRPRWNPAAPERPRPAPAGISARIPCPGSARSAPSRRPRSTARARRADRSTRPGIPRRCRSRDA